MIQRRGGGLWHFDGGRCKTRDGFRNRWQTRNTLEALAAPALGVFFYFCTGRDDSRSK